MPSFQDSLFLSMRTVGEVVEGQDLMVYRFMLLKGKLILPIGSCIKKRNVGPWKDITIVNSGTL